MTYHSSNNKNKGMSWIHMIPFEKATGKLKQLYNRIKKPDNNIDHVLQVHSLRPHTLSGHLSLYKNVLHHPDNTFDLWFLELIGTYTSYLNQCDYCYKHHFKGMKKALANDTLAHQIKSAITNDEFDTLLTEKQHVLLEYTKILTLSPNQLSESYINEIKALDISDGELLEVNQVVSYFNYANRTVLGLGVQLEKEQWNDTTMHQG